MEKTTGKIYKSIIAIMSDVEEIKKEQQNKQQGYKYRGIDDYCNTLHKPFSNHGVFITSKIIDHKSETIKKVSSKGEQYVFIDKAIIEYTFHADDGSSISTEVLGAGVDYSDKGVYKALSGAYKYALQQILMIPTDGESDAEKDDIQIINPLESMQKKVNELRKEMIQSGLFAKEETDTIRLQASRNGKDEKVLNEIYDEWSLVLKERQQS